MGCGNGNAIKSIQGIYPSTKCYGFGSDFYKEWEEQDKVAFIHAIGEDFPRHFKDGTIDLMYSRAGLIYFLIQNPEFITKLVKKLAPGGELIFDGKPVEKFLLEELADNSDYKIIKLNKAIIVKRKK